jgi:hypothetical protein
MTLFALNYRVNPLGSKRKERRSVEGITKSLALSSTEDLAALQSALSTPQIANMKILSFEICDACEVPIIAFQNVKK